MNSTSKFSTRAATSRPCTRRRSGRDGLEGPLPERQHGARQGAAARAADLLRLLLRAGCHPPLQAVEQGLGRVRRQGRDAAQRHAPGDRHRRTDARAGRRRGIGLGRGLGHRRPRLRLHESHAARRGLEKWSVPLFEKVLPRHLQIILEINRRHLAEVASRWPGDEGKQRARSPSSRKGP